MGKRLVVMQCGERSLGHLSLVFGLLAVGTLSLSVATDFWLFTTEALDPTALVNDGPPPPTPPRPQPPASAPPPPLPPPADELPLAADYDYDQLNTTDNDPDATDYGVNYPMPGDLGMYPIVVANMHSGLWRSCIYFDFEGGRHQHHHRHCF